MRAFAIVMMIQGHTIHSLLNISYSNSITYNIWLSLRAFTAPLFIFVSGFVFTFLLFQNKIEFKTNPRVKNGIKRGVTLILIGYLLRYPTINIFNLANVTFPHWVTFFAVDALHLIGIGLLLILCFTFITEKINVNPIITFALLGLTVFALSPVMNSLVWDRTKNIFLISYITKQFGSNFLIFPYLGYIFLGSIFGYLLRKNNKFLDNKIVSLKLLFGGVTIILLSLLIKTNYSVILLSVGVILLLLPSFGYISKKIKSPPNVVQSIAKNSLWIYIIHLILIYGSPTSIGLYQIVGKTQSASVAIFVAVAMVILMTIISLGIDKLKVTKFKVF